MCTRITCPRCGKPSFVGCGRHVEQVLSDVPHERRCRCNEQQAGEKPKSPLDVLLGWLK